MSRRSSAEIERDVEARRREVEVTLDALREKLSMGQLVDSLVRSFSTAGGHGGAVATNLARQVKETPLPALLTGIGLAWLLVSQSMGRRQSTGAEAPDGAPHSPYGPRIRLDAQALPGADPSEAPPFGESEEGLQGDDEPLYDVEQFTADETAHGAQFAVGQLRAGVYDLPGSGFAVGEGTRPHRPIATSGASSPSTRKRSKASDNDFGADFDRARHSVAEFIGNEPLIAGAIGIALGAAVGALLPGTRREDEMLGPHRDRLRDDAMSLAAKAADEVKSGVIRKVEGEDPKTKVDDAMNLAAEAADEVKSSVIRKVEGEEPKSKVDKEEPKAKAAKAEPKAQADKEEPKAQVDKEEPKAKADKPEPKAQVNKAEPKTKVDKAEPKTKVDKAEPKTKVDKAEPKTKVDKAEPKTKVDKAEPKT